MPKRRDTKLSCSGEMDLPTSRVGYILRLLVFRTRMEIIYTQPHIFVLASSHKDCHLDQPPSSSGEPNALSHSFGGCEAEGLGTCKLVLIWKLEASSFKLGVSNPKYFWNHSSHLQGQWPQIMRAVVQQYLEG